MFTSHICECKSCLKIHRAARFFYVWNTLFSTKKSFQLLKKSNIAWRRFALVVNLLIM